MRNEFRKRWSKNRSIQKAPLVWGLICAGLDAVICKWVQQNVLLPSCIVLYLLVLVHACVDDWRQYTARLLRWLAPLNLVSAGYYSAKLYIGTFSDWMFASGIHFMLTLIAAAALGIGLLPLIPQQRNLRHTDPG